MSPISIVLTWNDIKLCSILFWLLQAEMRSNSLDIAKFELHSMKTSYDKIGFLIVRIRVLKNLCVIV